MMQSYHLRKLLIIFQIQGFKINLFLSSKTARRLKQIFSLPDYQVNLTLRCKNQYMFERNDRLNLDQVDDPAESEVTNDVRY